MLASQDAVAPLPTPSNTNMPSAVDTFVDPTAGSPTAYGTSTDHAAEHAKLNDAAEVLENAVFGAVQTANNPGGLALLDALGRLPFSGLAPNVNIYAYGHNGLVVPGARSTSGADVLTLSKNRLEALSVTTYAVARSRMVDVFYDLLGGYGGAVAGATWPAGSGGLTGRSGIVVLDAEKEDFYNPTNTGGTTFGALTTGTVSQVTNYQQCLTACLALIRSSSRIEHTAGTASGTGSWTTNSGNFSGGSMASTTTQGETYTFTGITVPASGHLWVLGYTTTTATGDTSIAVNGVTVATATTSNTAGAPAIYSQRVGSINNPSTYQPQITQITGLTPGAVVSVAVSKSDSSANPIYFDCLLVPAQAPPLVVLVKDNLGNNSNPVPSSPVTNWSTMLTEGNANKPNLDTAIGSVLTMFTSVNQDVAVVDLGLGLSGADLSYVTGNEPNDRGMRKFSDLLTWAIGNWSYRNDSDGLYATL